MSEQLDHAVICVRDQMDRAEAIYLRMGFTLTERGLHAAGSCNHLMVFERDYLELIGFPPAGQTIRPDLRDAPIGLDGLVLATHDAGGVYRRLTDAGVPVGAPQPLSRMVRLPDRSEEARFTTVRCPRGAVAGGRLYFCQHETPHLIWNPAWQGHANGARSIHQFTIAVRNPEQEAIRYETILQSRPVRHDPDRLAFMLGSAELVLTTPAALSHTLGDLMCRPTESDGTTRADYMAMVTIEVEDLARTEAVLQAGGLDMTYLDRRTLAVPADQAMGCTIAFHVARARDRRHS